MPKRVPRKNVEPLLIDVKRPGFALRGSMKKLTVNLARATHFAEGKRNVSRQVWVALVAALILTLGIGGAALFLGFRGLEHTLATTGRTIVENFKVSAKALSSLEPREARARLAENALEFGAMGRLLDTAGMSNFLAALGSVVPAVRDGTSLLREVSAFNLDLLYLSERIAELQANGFRYFQSDGTRLLALLGEIRTSLQSVAARVQAVKAATAGLKQLSASLGDIDALLGEAYLAHAGELQELDRTLEALTALLGSEEPRHLLIMFQNPAEIRPGGGFLGSYADLVVRRGQMVSLDVRDIYDPDGQLLVKFIPPEPLRRATETWGARDANWFFDFPTSARAVVYFLERSGMYAEQGITFDAVVAMNINVFETVVRAVGPIALPEYGLVISERNFLAEVQREVEAGKDKAAGEPKRILKVLAPIVLERLGKLGEEERKDLLTALGAHLTTKDIMFYAEDQALLHAITLAGVGGAVYELPSSFWGSYLAVVDANVAGGKSDAFVDQMLSARLEVDVGGGVLTDLAVTRTHRGQNERDPWWRATNKNYLQILTNPGASLVALKGNDYKTSPSDAQYAGTGYETYPPLRAIEATKKFLTTLRAWTYGAFGKTVFATWFDVAAGKSRTLEARYQAPRVGGVKAGKMFTFIFDRQSGVRTSLKVSVFAPLGYVWAESGGSVATYEADDPAGRVVLTYTLAKQ